MDLEVTLRMEAKHPDGRAERSNSMSPFGSYILDKEMRFYIPSNFPKVTELWVEASNTGLSNTGLELLTIRLPDLIMISCP